MKTMLDNSGRNTPAILRTTKWWKFCHAVAAGFLFPMHSALASIHEEGGFDFPRYLVFSAMMLVTMAMFALLSWTIKKTFFQKLSWFPIVFSLSFLLSLALGILGTFGIPQYEPIFAIFGEDLPRGTQILLSARQLLWLPFILITWLYYSTRENPNKTRHFISALLVEAGLSVLIAYYLYPSVSLCKIVVI